MNFCTQFIEKTFEIWANTKYYMRYMNQYEAMNHFKDMNVFILKV